MKMLIIIKVLCLVNVNLFARDTNIIQFPDEELARESVLPVFKNQVAVRNKNAPKQGRFELGFLLGQQLTEAFYEPYNFGLSAFYHINEAHGIEFSALVFSTSESQYVSVLNEDVNETFNFKNAPTLKSMYLLSWDFTPYYGKISLTKQRVLNISIYTSLITGLVDNGLGNSVAFGLGFGQKVHFGPNWGLRLDLKGLAFKQVDPLSNPDALRGISTGPFEEEMALNLLLNFGLFSYLPFL